MVAAAHLSQSYESHPPKIQDPQEKHVFVLDLCIFGGGLREI